MKIAIIVPSEQYLTQAGTRIRYQRIEDGLAANGWTMSLVPMEELGGSRSFNADAVLFSKCQDARAVALAYEARTAGLAVGVDLFDDYFSQLSDVRFAPQRSWLRQMAESASFFLCSTPRMAQVAENYFQGAPGHVLSDPFGAFDAKALPLELAQKREQALRERRLNVLWFGIGDNPNFPVGLHDLAANAEVLRGLAQGGFDVRLTILTNRRALDQLGLARLRSLTVPFTVEEWSVERESEALASHLISFVPVNAQGFSIAKSLNRGVSALTGGTQLLSAGYPLYAPLGNFVYRDPAALIADLETDTLLLRPDTLDAFSGLIRNLSDPDHESSRLAGFINDMVSVTRAAQSLTPAVIAILHGSRTTGGIHKFAQGRGWLSLGSPFTPAGAAYDAHLGFFGEGRTPAFRFSKRFRDLLDKPLRSLAIPVPASEGKGPPFEIPLTNMGVNLPMKDLASSIVRSCGDRISTYTFVMAETLRLYTGLLEGIRIFGSELEAALTFTNQDSRQTSRATFQ